MGCHSPRIDARSAHEKGPDRIPLPRSPSNANSRWRGEEHIVEEASSRVAERERIPSPSCPLGSSLPGLAVPPQPSKHESLALAKSEPDRISPNTV